MASSEVYGVPFEPTCKSKAIRLQTFKGREHNFSLPVIQLAEAGLFYTGPGDRTTCFASGCILYQWGELDNPLEEHRKWFPECKWAELKATDPDSVMCFEDCPAVQIVVDLGYSKESVRYAYRRLGINNPSAVDLLDVLFDDNKEPLEEEKSIVTERNESCHLQREVNIRSAHANEEECERLRERLAHLEKTFECKCCGGNADMCSLPCGHIALCEKCVYKYKQCLICKTRIIGVVKTYRV